MLKEILDGFQSNAEDVERLVNFDREVLQVVVSNLEELHERLKPHHGTDQMNGGRVLQIVQGIRQNDSLRLRYSVIFNQAIVLLVSHFASSLGDIFRTAIAHELDRTDNNALLDEDIKLTFREMKDRNWNLQSAAADLLIAKKDFTFQDMGSTARAFESYVGIKLERDAIVNNIILGQAARHVIVHAGAVTTDRMVKQVSGATPRSLKPVLRLGERIQFTSQEVSQLKHDMLNYMTRLAERIDRVE